MYVFFLKMARFRFYALWLCLICIGVFLLQFIPGFTEVFILNEDSFVQPWRFLSAIFLHGGLVHLLYNLFALALFGSVLEKFIGGKKFLLVFFLSGIFANLVSVNFYTASLGASGAVYGILGCLTLLRPGMMVWAFGFPMPMFIASLLWVGGAVLGIFMPSNIGHIAHLSGILIGFLFGLWIRLEKKRKKRAGYSSEIRIPEVYIRDWENRYMR